jgi:BirA family biotin operon repressor/biotin-[acetyl-CoA-carboxylase] ligase
VGIGLNINQRHFPFPNAASLSDFSGVRHDLNMIFQRLIESVEAEYLSLKAGQVTVLKQRYLSSLYKFRELHRFESNGEQITGSIYDVDESGRLFIESSGRTLGFSFKEIRF